jgi:hypothetical protein
MKKSLTVEEQLLLLAYGAIPSISEFAKAHPDLPESLKKRAGCILYCARLVADQKISSVYIRRKVDSLFANDDIGEFFDSLVSSDSNDLRDLKLITKLVESFHEFTDSGMEKYADFTPFTSFAHSHWLELMIRVQKSNFLSLELKNTVELFIAKGFSLILHPALNEYGTDACQFFSWFEKLECHDGEKIVTSAIKIWKEHEKDESYNISGGPGEEVWYQDALEFAIKLSSKEHVSKVFAEKFKKDYPEIYEKFKLLVGLDDYDISIPKVKTAEEKELADVKEIQELFGQHKHAPDDLVEIIYQDKRVKLLAPTIFAISTDITDNRNAHVKETLMLLLEKHGDCELVKELTLLFTNNLEEAIATDSLEYSDLPPSALYISNEDWHWLF